MSWHGNEIHYGHGYTANLLYCFDWEVPNGIKREDINLVEGFGLTIHKMTPLYLVPILYMILKSFRNNEVPGLRLNLLSFPAFKIGSFFFFLVIVLNMYLCILPTKTMRKSDTP